MKEGLLHTAHRKLELIAIGHGGSPKYRWAGEVGEAGAAGEVPRKKSSKAVEHKVIDTTLVLKCQWTGPEEYTDQENIPILQHALMNHPAYCWKLGYWTSHLN